MLYNIAGGRSEDTMRKKLSERSGKYGQAKCKAFYIMANRGDWISSRELLLLTGLSYPVLAALLLRWTSYEYIERRLTYQFGIGTFEYRLKSRGRGCHEALRDKLPNYQMFIDELHEWLQYISPRLPELMAGKFKDAVKVREGFSAVIQA